MSAPRDDDPPARFAARKRTSEARPLAKVSACARLLLCVVCIASLPWLAGCSDAPAASQKERQGEQAPAAIAPPQEKAPEAPPVEPLPADPQRAASDAAEERKDANAEPAAADSQSSEPAPARPADAQDQPAASAPKQKESGQPEIAGKPGADGVRECTFDDVKFEMEKTEPFRRSLITPKINELVGKRIRIRGYMFPTFQKSGLTEFVLVRDNMECCFGPGAALYDCIFVEMNKGVFATYSYTPITVQGTFSISEMLGPDGTHLAIYHLQAEAVQ